MRDPNTIYTGRRRSGSCGPSFVQVEEPGKPPRQLSSRFDLRDLGDGAFLVLQYDTGEPFLRYTPIGTDGGG